VDLRGYRRRIGEQIVTVVRQRHIANAQSIQHAQGTDTVSDLMEAFDPDQTCDAARTKAAPDTGGRVGELQDCRVCLDQAVDYVELLKRLAEGF
jgi:hypothetical protein